jgi:hypothetical protein
MGGRGGGGGIDSASTSVATVRGGRLHPAEVTPIDDSGLGVSATFRATFGSAVSDGAFSLPALVDGGGMPDA